MKRSCRSESLYVTSEASIVTRVCSSAAYASVIAPSLLSYGAVGVIRSRVQSMTWIAC